MISPILAQTVAGAGRLLAFLSSVCVQIWRFLVYVYYRFEADRCLTTASSLTYTTLLALVPLSTIGVFVLSQLPAFAKLKVTLNQMVLEYLVPDVGSDIASALDRFTANAGALTVIGVVGLLLTAVATLFTIESSFNQIWRVRRSRSVLQRMLAFWAVVTLAPVLFAVSLTLSGTFVAWLSSYSAAAGPSPLLLLLYGAVPILMQAAAVTVMFLIIPNRRSRWTDAIAGGLIAAILFQAAREVFQAYIADSATYSTLYGALSVIPVFLLWVYILWTIILIGAEVAAALPEWAAGFAEHRDPGAALRRQALPTAIAILGQTAARQSIGRPVKLEAIMRGSPLPPLVIEMVAGDLAERGWLLMTEEGGLVLGRDPGRTTLRDLMSELTLLPPTRLDARARRLPWAELVDARLALVDQAGRDALSLPLATLFQQSPGQPPLVALEMPPAPAEADVLPPLADGTRARAHASPVV